MPYADPEAQKAAKRRWYLANREKALERAKAQAAKRFTDPAARETWRRHKRTHRHKRGALPLAEYLASRRAAMLQRKAERDDRASDLRVQRAAFRQWLTVTATDEEVAKHFAATGKPWNNPRLNPSEQRRLRYQVDPQFHRREQSRLRATKRARRHQIRAAAGDLTPALHRELLAEAHTCRYCGIALTQENWSLDHVVPLSKGGAHDRTNVVPSCRSCNSSKKDGAWPTSVEVE